MKQKINLRLVSIAILAIFVTLISITAVYYGIFQERVKKDLEIQARLLSEAGISDLVENEGLIGDKDIRITWISKEGEVIFDNDADVGSLSNHMDRPEVKDAFEKGYGESDRKSDTMKLRTYYYAVLLEDGTVLRVATEARSVLSVTASGAPVVSVILLAIIGLCVIISRLLTRQLIAPIREMAEKPDENHDVGVYSELTPFMDKIREQHENVLAAAKSRQDFTANVSHELKTPITAISGYAELIENNMVDDDQKIKFAEEIRKNANRLVSVINDTIKLSELDHGASLQEFEKIDLNSIIEERIDLLQNNAREKNITLTYYGESCETISNQELMIELIDNLVQNAIRYNVENGRVDVRLRKKDNHAVIKVADTGIGIPKADQERVFERFYRVDKSRSRETGGTGLGLAIVKHIVELHGGTIDPYSEVGKGTEITVEI